MKDSDVIKVPPQHKMLKHGYHLTQGKTFICD
jgi:hypothetical protein